MCSPEEQESEDDKTLDENSEGEVWSKSSEFANLSDDSDVTISRNKRSTKEDANKKREQPVADSNFYGKAFPNPPLTEISPYMYFKIFLMVS